MVRSFVSLFLIYLIISIIPFFNYFLIIKPNSTVTKKIFFFGLKKGIALQNNNNTLFFDALSQSLNRTKQTIEPPETTPPCSCVGV
ncbi:hypothetical protein NC652_007714 [Populus alba x Populus x berolinensis]|nr:hypothetical protein NC652_007714 [Populus alba x Populus x berolinensis]